MKKCLYCSERIKPWQDYRWVQDLRGYMHVSCYCRYVDENIQPTPSVSVSPSPSPGPDEMTFTRDDNA